MKKVYKMEDLDLTIPNISSISDILQVVYVGQWVRGVLDMQLIIWKCMSN